LIVSQIPFRDMEVVNDGSMSCAPNVPCYRDEVNARNVRSSAEIISAYRRAFLRF